MTEDFQKIQDRLSKKLSLKRYTHTMGVSYTAASMAMRYNISMEDAAYAGLLHDCAKYMTDEQLINKCNKHGISCTEVELRNGFLLHAKLGAYYAHAKYAINNDDIISAVRYHTTGRLGMTILEAIIFTADYIEPNRKPIPNLANIRHMSFIDLDEAVYMILQNTLNYLGDEIDKGIHDREIDNHTVEAYNYYKKIHDEKY